MRITIESRDFKDPVYRDDYFPWLEFLARLGITEGDDEIVESVDVDINVLSVEKDEV